MLELLIKWTFIEFILFVFRNITLKAVLYGTVGGIVVTLILFLIYKIFMDE